MIKCINHVQDHHSSKNLLIFSPLAKSPVFTHLAATLNGLATIRSCNAEGILQHEFDSHQDTHTAYWFMFITSTSALGFVLDIMGFLFVSCIIYYFMLFDSGVSGNEIGLAITQALSMSSLLQWGVRQSAEASNQMMAVERIVEYRSLEMEPTPAKVRETPREWPTEGKLQLENVVYRYYADAEPVLRGVSLVIEATEKIGIVGRTGAGERRNSLATRLRVSQN